MEEASSRRDLEGGVTEETSLRDTYGGYPGTSGAIYDASGDAEEASGGKGAGIHLGDTFNGAHGEAPRGSGGGGRGVGQNMSRFEMYLLKLIVSGDHV